MMQAGRELDVKVAEALGWKPYLDEDFNDWATEENGWVPEFSTKWGSMGVLVEEAKKKGIFLEYAHEDQGYIGRAWEDGWSPDTPVVKEAPMAVTIAFLATQGVYITGMDLT